MHAMLPKFKIFWKCNFPLKLSREVVVCIESMAFILITHFFYFNYFYFVLFSILLQKLITSLEKSGEGKRTKSPRLHRACTVSVRLIFKLHLNIIKLV